MGVSPGLCLLNIFIKNLDDKAESSHTKSAYDIMAGVAEGHHQSFGEQV